MAAPENPVEDFRQAVAATLRALGHAPDVELAFTADKPSCFGDQARVPQPGRALPADQVAEVRGWADSFALRKRHHDADAAQRRPARCRAGARHLERGRTGACRSAGRAGNGRGGEKPRSHDRNAGARRSDRARPQRRRSADGDGARPAGARTADRRAAAQARRSRRSISSAGKSKPAPAAPR